MKELMSKGMSLERKKKIVNTFIWSVMLYGCESWTLRKKKMKQIDVGEMWLWRRLLKISWREKTWIGHVLRANAYLRNI